MRRVFQLLTLLGVASMALSKSLYDPVRSYVTILNPKNFDIQVTKNRQKGISIVQFYKDTDGVSKGIAGQYENFAKENKGLFRILAVDCDEFESLCNKENVRDKFPLFRVYPTYPAPTEDYEEDTIDFDKLKKMAGRWVSSRVVEVNSNNYDTFISDNPGKPRVILFTDKKGIPLIYKALSSHFDKTLIFGLIRDSETSLIRKYNVKSYPAIFLIKDKDAKPQRYEGKEYSYQAVFDFINIYSETFVFRDQNEEVVSAASKPWLSDRVPQVTRDSFEDICLKKEASLCVIYIEKDAASKNNEILDQLYQTGQQFSSKIDRGINFSFMWLDASQEPAFTGMFGVSQEELPRLVVLNHGKRKRYLVHDKAMVDISISETLDKIVSGDGKFTAIKGNQLAELVSKYPQEATK